MFTDQWHPRPTFQEEVPQETLPQRPFGYIKKRHLAADPCFEVMEYPWPRTRCRPQVVCGIVFVNIGMSRDVVAATEIAGLLRGRHRTVDLDWESCFP